MQARISANIASIRKDAETMLRGTANEKRAEGIKNYWLYVSNVSSVCHVSKAVARELLSWQAIKLEVNNLRRIINERKSNKNVSCRTD